MPPFPKCAEEHAQFRPAIMLSVDDAILPVAH